VLSVTRAVEEASETCLSDVLLVTGRNEFSVEDHFDRVDGLGQALLERQHHVADDPSVVVLPTDRGSTWERTRLPSGRF
jgi:UTP-glucose-1-phosphate uridylyltransferase